MNAISPNAFQLCFALTVDFSSKSKSLAVSSKPWKVASIVSLIAFAILSIEMSLVYPGVPATPATWIQIVLLRIRIPVTLDDLDLPLPNGHSLEIMAALKKSSQLEITP
jgi:hypothetical protein